MIFILLSAFIKIHTTSKLTLFRLQNSKLNNLDVIKMQFTVDVIHFTLHTPLEKITNCIIF